MTSMAPVDADALKELVPNLTSYMPDTLIRAVGAVSHELAVEPGQTLITEGEASNALYLIREGTFGIYRAAPNGGDMRVAEIGPGQPFGEMALLDGEPRAASVRAETAGLVLEIEPEALRTQPGGEAEFQALKGALATFVTRRMRATTQEHVEALERELALRAEQEQFGRFFIYSLTMMSIGTLVNNALARREVDVDIYTQLFAWQYLAILLVPSFLVIRHMGISIQSLGLTTRGLKRSLSEGAVISVALYALTWVIAATLKYFDALPGKALPFDLLGTLSYFLHSALQEIIARGFLQSSFQRFLGDSNGLWSVLLASTLFGMFHLHFGLVAVLMTIATGCVFGLIYMRHQNVAGVTLVHYVMGVAAFNTGLI